MGLESGCNGPFPRSPLTWDTLLFPNGFDSLTNSMSAGFSVAVSEEDRQTLQHLSDLLHIFHHRNKNQHRRSTWWRHFSIFRKQLTCLSNETTSLHETPTTYLEKSRKKSHDPQTRKQLEQRTSFWQDVMIAKWQHAFSQVAADGRFSVLGLVLLATLAEACRITGITAAIEDLGQAEVEKVLARFAKESWEAGDGATVKQSPLADREDYGEVISREPVVESDVSLDETTKPKESASSTITQASSTTAPSKQDLKRSASKIIDIKKKKRQKKRKGDAIDDLFSGLG